MFLPTPYKLLDVKPDDAIVNFDFYSIKPEDWTSWTRPQSYVLFKDLSCFLLLYLANGITKPPVPTNTGHPLFELCMNEARKLEKYYDGRVLEMSIHSLPPGGHIPIHSDVGKVTLGQHPYHYYNTCHRVHLPLVTNPGVKFIMEKKEHYFKPFEYFELNNRSPHEIRNDSDKVRIHLVIDVLPNSIDQTKLII